MRAPGLMPLVGAIGAMIVWSVHFLAVYGLQAVICARVLADRSAFGFGITTLTVIGLGVVACLAILALGVDAFLRLRRAPMGGEGAHPRFLALFSVTTALLAGLAVVWETVPALLLPPCG